MSVHTMHASLLTGEFERYALAPRSGIETTTPWLTGGEQVFVIVAAIHIRRKDVRVSSRENVRQEWYAKDADSVDSLCLRSDSKRSITDQG